VDITDTGAPHSPYESIEYNQYQNLNVLVQTISLRAQPLDIQVICLLDQDTAKYDFGSSITGIHKIWSMDFYSERETAWIEHDDPLGGLLNDIDGQAFNGNLLNTMVFDCHMFKSHDINKNVTFKKLNNQ